jgi:uncharacterized protein YrrD
MNLKSNAAVVAADGREVGRVDRVVIDPYSKDVTYLVVRKVALFTQDKILPIGYVTVRDDAVVIQSDAGNLEDLPDFEETHYVPTGNSTPGSGGAGLGAASLYYYPPFGTQLFYGGSGAAASLHFDRTLETSQNIPQNNVALKPGVRVYSRDGKQVGDVAEIIADAHDKRMSHLVISAGLLFKTRKIVPAAWVTDVSEDAVHLAVGDEALDRLRDYAQS